MSFRFENLRWAARFVTQTLVIISFYATRSVATTGVIRTRLRTRFEKSYKIISAFWPSWNLTHLWIKKYQNIILLKYFAVRSTRLICIVINHLTVAYNTRLTAAHTSRSFHIVRISMFPFDIMLLLCQHGLWKLRSTAFDSWIVQDIRIPTVSQQPTSTELFDWNARDVW